MQTQPHANLYARESPQSKLLTDMMGAQGNGVNASPPPLSTACSSSTQMHTAQPPPEVGARAETRPRGSTGPSTFTPPANTPNHAANATTPTPTVLHARPHPPAPCAAPGTTPPRLTSSHDATGQTTRPTARPPPPHSPPESSAISSSGADCAPARRPPLSASPPREANSSATVHRVLASVDESTCHKEERDRDYARSVLLPELFNDLAADMLRDKPNDVIEYTLTWLKAKRQATLDK